MSKVPLYPTPHGNVSRPIDGSIISRHEGKSEEYRSAALYTAAAPSSPSLCLTDILSPLDASSSRSDIISAMKTLSLTDYLQVDTLGIRRKSVNFAAEKSSSCPNWWAQIDLDSCDAPVSRKGSRVPMAAAPQPATASQCKHSHFTEMCIGDSLHC